MVEENGEKVNLSDLEGDDAEEEEEEE